MTEHIIRHCAPTLAGMKAAGLFAFSFTSELVLANSIADANRILRPHGLCAELLRARGGSALILVYRVCMLRDYLARADIAEFLAGQGYRGGLRRDLDRLRLRLSQQDFPHEIGVFPGYPLHDVRGFIRNNGKNCKLTGCRKVYENVSAAQKLFARYGKCSRIYIELYLQGRPIERLIVAA